MYVINENGEQAINLEMMSSFGMGTVNETGEAALVASQGSITYLLASGGDRPLKAAEAITQALKAGKRVLDLNSLLGAKPDLTIAKSLIIPQNGGKKPPTRP